MEIHYKKNNNGTFFDNCKNDTLLGARNVQNYIPIYDKFFNLSEQNYNNINLNNLYIVNSLNEKLSDNKFNGKLLNTQSNDTKDAKIFFKYCPLLDPIKYITDKYDVSDNLLNLPQFGLSNSHPKMLDRNNSAYIDGFFTFLTSKLLHEHSFLHGVDFYGSFLAVKNNFMFNIGDDVDYLFNMEEFHKNNNKLFKLENAYHLDMLNYDTRNNKKRLVIGETNSKKDKQDNKLDADADADADGKNDEIFLELSNIHDLNKLDKVFITDSIVDDVDNKMDETNLIFQSKINSQSKHTNSSGSTCSSRSSNTENSDDEGEEGDDDDNEEGDSSGEGSSEESCSTATEDEVFISIKEFPIEIISLECCENTLDSYITSGNIKDNEWDSIVLQILMILITYQKMFNMTHNDLHTNNIMYNATDKKYLHYKINNKHYKVPTFGKIYKIIDYGRAIYTFKKEVMCSDSYHKDGDAATQYNFGEYRDENKPTIEPNYSFDLCRLSCSLFDFFIEDIDEVPKLRSPIKKIIIGWCLDDKDRNILYKNNGEERYPDFKLYKMIARSVHKHVPIDVLQNPHFEKYAIAKKKINKSAQIMNIDDLPVYV
jgi:hypothetical protein